MKKAKEYKELHNEIAAFICKFCCEIHFHTKFIVKGHMIHPRYLCSFHGRIPI